MSTIRSRITGSPGSGLSVIAPVRVFMLVRQARPFLPLMFIASEPQTPSRQERRNDSERSCCLSLSSASSSMRSWRVEPDLDGLHAGLGVLVRVVAVDVECALLHGLCSPGAALLRMSGPSEDCCPPPAA